jgi:hypothetical protein
MRTALAVMRTVFATLSIHGTTALWAAVQLVTLTMLVVVMGASAVIGVYRCELARHCPASRAWTSRAASLLPPALLTGGWCPCLPSCRYYRIAKILSLKEIPASFGKNRVPVWPVTVVFASSIATVAIASLLNGFDK